MALPLQINGNQLGWLAKAVAIITGHAELQAIHTTEAVGITGTDESGIQAAFSYADA